MYKLSMYNTILAENNNIHITIFNILCISQSYLLVYNNSIYIYFAV